jgi:hypothetical protein
VDNSQNIDGIKEYLASRHPEVRYLDAGGNMGFGRAQNMGLKSAQARFYLPLNPDIVFSNKQQVLAEIIEWMEKNHSVGAVGPRLLNSDGTVQESCCRFHGFLDPLVRRLELDHKYVWARQRVDRYLMRDFDHEQIVPVDWLMGSFLLVRGEAARQVGFFDDRFFMYFEDCDWCRRLWQAGWQVYYYPKARVRHAHRRESAEIAPWKALFASPTARMHVASWLKFFWKWKFKRQSYGI